MIPKKKTLFDIANDISYKKEYIYEQGIYNHYLTVIYFSLHLDTLFIANKANILTNIPDRLHHDFLFYMVNKRKRFSKWPKKEMDENIAIIQSYYKYSFHKAKSVASLLSDDQLAKIKQELTQGGNEYEPNAKSK